MENSSLGKLAQEKCLGDTSSWGSPNEMIQQEQQNPLDKRHTQFLMQGTPTKRKKKLKTYRLSTSPIISMKKEQNVTKRE